MKIGLYIEHGVGNGVGGAELLMAHLASVWSADHSVDLIHHRPPLTRARIASFSDEDYSRVNVRYVPRDRDAPAYGNPLARYRAARDWHRDVSAGYDLFVNCTHWLPCFCHAKVGVVLVLFPFYFRPTEMPEIARLPAWKRARHSAYYLFEWRQRMATYQHRLSISQFSREWTRRRWKIDSDILYPPVDVAFAVRSKKPMVLSVGRFSTRAHTKKQMEMMGAFKDLQAGSLARWSYASVGGLNARQENHDYFAAVRAAGQGCAARVEANLDRGSVRSLFEEASIFWHATGLNDDTDARPELCEHFGISTVEAMAAGCVPVVIDKGGQPEIVRHGEDGFVWNTLDEMKRYTRQLAADDALRTRMAASARQRAEGFARERFVARISSLCGIPLPRSSLHAAAIGATATA